MCSSAFNVNVNVHRGLSCLAWVNKGEPVLDAGVEFDMGPVAMYRESNGGVVGKVRVKRRCNRQTAERAEHETHAGREA